jgi:monofunctional biosynthetic peptidoglycan transglycosylase
VTFKRILLLLLILLVITGGIVGYAFVSLPSVEPLKKRSFSMTIQVKDWQGDYHPFVVGPKNPYWAGGKSIPAEMKWAVILAEDDNFYRHEGIDVKAIKKAIQYDLEKQSLARGASTITQQTAKNLFLSREKTISRKIKEVILAKRMEQELTKGRILELYLNVVELGPMVYGIGHGARYYFGKPASALTPRESSFLAAMLPGPRVAYNPYRNVDKVMKRSDMILKLLRKRGVLSEDEYQRAVAEIPNIAGLQRKVDESIKKVEVFPNRTGAILPALPADGASGESPAREEPGGVGGATRETEPKGDGVTPAVEQK